MLLFQSLLFLAAAPVANAWISPVGRRHPHSASTSLLTATSSTSTEVGSITECDDENTPPSLNVILSSLQDLTGSDNSDIRGRFVDHKQLGSLVHVSNAIREAPQGQPVLTPFAAYCIGHALGSQLVEEIELRPITIGLGIDPRPHSMRLADSLARGAESVDGVQVVFAGIASTPGCAAFCRLDKCDGAVMVTASHLPIDRNGFKFFSRSAPTGFSSSQVQVLGAQARNCAVEVFGQGVIPPSSGNNAVMCSEHAEWMPDYADSLKQAILLKTQGLAKNERKPLEGLRIVLNSGNGSGGFFNEVLKDLGADVSASMNLEPDGTFPAGIPNPEYLPMEKQTMDACEAAQADLGIMLDTDADRCGFVVPRTVGSDGSRSDFEALNRNRLIALLAVIFANEKPGCAVVTDSVTSEGLACFLEQNLGLKHVRYLKGYANVINKAKELTETGVMDAQLAIETSGHCAMKENGYLDDGTYTAVQVVSLMARERSKGEASLLHLISEMGELDEVAELRMTARDGSLETMRSIFDICFSAIANQCSGTGNQQDGTWTIDAENLEGIRVRLGHSQFFMLRKSLHDPIISLQIEARSREEARNLIVEPVQRLFQSNDAIEGYLDSSVLGEY